MGYGSEALEQVTENAKSVASKLVTYWEEAGLQVSNQHENKGKIKLSLSDPATGSSLNLDICEELLLADGFMPTGRAVRVSPEVDPKETMRVMHFNEIALNMPHYDGLCEKMQGPYKDNTKTLAKDVTAFLKKQKPQIP